MKYIKSAVAAITIGSIPFKGMLEYFFPELEDFDIEEGLLFDFFVFYPLLLVLNCFFIFLFKRHLGPQGTFGGSAGVLTIALVASIFELAKIAHDGGFCYFDLGRGFICADLIDSHLLFCADPLAVLSSILVLSLTILAMHFGVEYMYRDAFINRLLYLLCMFATSVILLFYSYDFFLILVAGELIGGFSFLLVNFYSMRIYTMKAALKTFVFSRLSDTFMLLAFMLSVLIFNTSDLSAIFLQIPYMLYYRIFIGTFSFHFLSFFAAALSISGLIKAAQFFFHVGLPDAMEAPTPASALIHSSTLVVAGVYLIIRFSIIFEFTIELNYFIALGGAITIAFGALVAAFQTDIKKLVAYSTISQIGYLVCGCGFCCYEEVLVYLIIHAINKALLFILVGFIVHYFSGNTDMRQMGGAYVYSFDIVCLIFGITLNLAGLPYSAGFYAKEFLLFQITRDTGFSFIIRGCGMVSFLFTPLYMFMLVSLSLFGVKRAPLAVYKAMFEYDYGMNRIVIYWYPRKGTSLPFIMGDLLMRLQLTAFCSRLSTLIFFSVGFSYHFYGETLLKLVFSMKLPSNVVSSPNFFSINENPTFTSCAFSFITADILMFIILLSALYGFVNFFFGKYLHATYGIFYETCKDIAVSCVLLALTSYWLYNISLGLVAYLMYSGVYSMISFAGLMFFAAYSRRNSRFPQNVYLYRTKHK